MLVGGFTCLRYDLHNKIIKTTTFMYNTVRDTAGVTGGTKISAKAVGWE